MRDVVAPGHPSAQHEALEELRLVIETVNPTGWTALKRRLLSTDAHALLAQETWVDQSAMAGAAAWARRQGWRSVWAPAVTTTRGGTAAGVAIFVRDCFGLRLPTDRSHVLSPARAVMGVMEVPGGRPLRLISCYLRHGKYADDLNAATLGEIGAAVDQCGDDEVYIVAGDFNRDPSDLAAIGYDRQVSATLFHTPTERGTYRTAKARSTIDYFLVADRLAAAVDAVRTVEASGVRGHVPVQVVFKPRLAAVRALQIRQPPRLPTERVYGPIPPPGAWGHRKEVASAALAAARAGSPMTEKILEAAYKVWADGAEEDLEAYAGVTLAKRGERGKRPKLVWRTVLPEKKIVHTYPTLAAAVWLRGIAAEMQRIVALAAAAAPGDADRHADARAAAADASPPHGRRRDE